MGTATDKTNLEVVIVAGTAGQMTVTMPARGDKEANAFEGHVTVLGSLRILNLRLVEGGKVGSHYIFVRYAVTADGALEVWLLREESVKQAIASGKLKGRRDQYGSTTLDDTAENMSAWLRGQKPEVVFEKFATFVKK